MKKTILMFIIAFIVSNAISQNAPKGWKFGGALPAIAYDSDVGFRYGALGYIYDWGDGTQYPNYMKSIYLEWSRTTKGSGITRIQYDDRKFFGSKIRFTSELGYYIEQALDFYGFNGFQSKFDANFSDPNSSSYKSRMFYRADRRTLRGIFDFQIPINDKILVYTGISLFSVKMGSVDIAKLNKNKKPEQLLPSLDSVPGIFEKYQTWGLLPSEEINGGFVPLFKIGIVYDTRDKEALPTKGLWEEAFITVSPGIQGRAPYYQLFAAHRQYFNIITNRLSFAYRLVYMGKLAGNVPYFMLPVYLNTKDIQDAVGGSKTVRGIMRSRIVADAVAMGTAEIRWRVLNTKLFKQDFYIALSSFVDATRIIIPYKVDLTNVPQQEKDIYFSSIEKDIYKFHLGYGGGLRFALNENFIVAVDYGLTNNKQDGASGLYIGLGWMF